MNPSKELVEETKKLLQLKFFLEQEVGLKVNLSVAELKYLAKAIETQKKNP